MTTTFDTQRKGTGVQEWAEHSHNWGIGCSHNCRYCYARGNALRYKIIADPNRWPVEYIKPGREKIKFVKKPGVIMTPTTTDITPFYLHEAIRSFKGLLQAGNQLLIVSKPHIDCIPKLCEELEPWKPQVLFRFTIGTMEDKDALFWEPGAPGISERMVCLAYAHKYNWKTSVSCEPILGGYDTAMELVKAVEPWVTDTIWLGRMNHIRRRVDCREREVLTRVQEIERLQRDSEMLRLYDDLLDNPRVRFKDSIMEIVRKVEG